MLARGGGYFFRQLADAVGNEHGEHITDRELSDALWELVWTGLVTNDTLAPLRSHIGGGTHRREREAVRVRHYRGRASARAALVTRVGSPSVAGRWSLLPPRDDDATVRAHSHAELLLERYGVVTRGSVLNEGMPGGFALAYRVLSRFEESGRARRGYFVESLGGAQFAAGATVDRLRSFSRDPNTERAYEAVALAATDPANPYGAALPWPHLPQSDSGTGHRPGRKAGAMVVLVDGELVLYLERGGKSMLCFVEVSDPRSTENTADANVLAAPPAVSAATRALAVLVTGHRIEKLTVETINGVFVIGTVVGDALSAAGFLRTPRGLRLRS